MEHNNTKLESICSNGKGADQVPMKTELSPIVHMESRSHCRQHDLPLPSSIDSGPQPSGNLLSAVAEIDHTIEKMTHIIRQMDDIALKVNLLAIRTTHRTVFRDALSDPKPYG